MYDSYIREIKAVKYLMDIRLYISNISREETEEEAE